MLGLGFRRAGYHVRVRDLVTSSDYCWPEEGRQAHRRAVRRRKRAEAEWRAEAETTVLLRRTKELEAKFRAGSV
ncbi:MAG: hypothetical protein OXN97_24380 [Bryobacterales bacterium]|nr:hypothetical protein [Bryobacterales bacterium]